MALHWKSITAESEWEWFVLQYSPQALFQSYSWGEVLKRSGTIVERYGLYDGEKLMAVAQAVLVRAKRGTFLHIRHGPIVNGDDVSVWKQMVTKLKELARTHHAVFLRISPVRKESDALLNVFRSDYSTPAAIHRMDGEYCWVLGLEPEEHVLLSGMRKTTRYEIRRAEKEGVKVFSTRDPKYLKDFFALYSETSVRQGFVPHTGIADEFAVFAKTNQAVLYLGQYEGKTLAAAIIVYYGNQAIYHHGASVQSKVSASHAIQWQAIRDAKKRGMKVYNFWGIAPDNSPKHPWRGITLFKQGFGGHTEEYMHARDFPLSPLYFISRSVELARRMIKGYD